ncbi:hypothetical protein [Microvirga arsenatis]|uniref:Uncharacterized protein n=1 Tax=Microvirga arsenatis TaxID=2692265 RepID=A0ABW9YVH8_9HYPH|nr:hypothetical protein [Microvirga arsenatis]NBJ10735.1 hypothetical protein [Microvirga arsenatis]NBJ24367.1 hypothetical protein [Microvirga arsenatis]
MSLQSVADRVEYALLMIKNSEDACRFEGGLWYHAIAVLNGFYAIREELKNSTANTPDRALSDAVKAWRNLNGSKLNSFFGRARDTATHQGAITTCNHTEWEVDIWHDTSFPEKYARITVKDSTIVNMRGDEFLALAHEAFSFLKAGIVEIEADYKAQGGANELLDKPEDLSSIFGDEEL